MMHWTTTAASLLSLLLMATSHAQDASAKRATAIADEYIAEFTKRFPEAATLSGFTLPRHDGLTDNSLEALAEWQTLEDRWASELASIDSASLFGRPEWVTLGFVREAVDASRKMRVCRYELWPANQMSGWQVTMAQLAAVQPVALDSEREQALARWSQLPGYLDVEIDNLKQGLQQGYSTPRANVQLTIEQLEELLAAPVEKWPLFSPAERAKSEPFTARWTALLAKQIKPAIQRYNDYLKTQYAPRARDNIAVTAHPQGKDCYAATFRSYTTIDRTPEQTFELGQREVERNQTTALEIGKRHMQVKDLTALRQRLKSDPDNHFKSREDLLQFAKDAVERSRVAMPKWFARVPQASLVVEPYPDFLERTASDSYWPADQSGSRPAMYRITLYGYQDTTRANAEITAFHEGYPGHHLQIGIATERPAAHPITRLVGNSAFAEGWARYAEALAEEMKLYSSPYALANRRLWPARGMVVDPGIHVLGWTREQALQFIADGNRFEGPAAAALVDRIVAWPGQLTAYDTGALEFFALRKLAQDQLKDRFDLREFHSIVLENGTVTLPMLREQVMHWLKGKQPR